MKMQSLIRNNLMDQIVSFFNIVQMAVGPPPLVLNIYVADYIADYVAK